MNNNVCIYLLLFHDPGYFFYGVSFYTIKVLVLIPLKLKIKQIYNEAIRLYIIYKLT